VRSALLSVNGVTRAQVKLEGHEAIVTYDPAKATIAEMIKAVGEAEGPGDGKGQYKASVKK